MSIIRCTQRINYFTHTARQIFVISCLGRRAGRPTHYYVYDTREHMLSLYVSEHGPRRTAPRARVEHCVLIIKIYSIKHVMHPAVFNVHRRRCCCRCRRHEPAAVHVYVVVIHDAAHWRRDLLSPGHTQQRVHEPQNPTAAYMILSMRSVRSLVDQASS